jgi:hypothetical protein
LTRKGTILNTKTEKYISRVFVALFIVGVVIGGCYALGIGFPKAQVDYTDKWGQTFVGTWDGANFVGPVDLSFEDGSSYKGGIRNGTFDGQGQFLSVDGWNVQAAFTKGKPTKTDTFTSSRGDTYTGQILEVRPDGEGTFTSIDGWNYSGQWKNGMPEGRGVFTFPDGSTYSGNFVSGLAEGQGEYLGGAVWEYSGEFYGGYRQGRGVMTLGDGTELSGQWDSGLLISETGASN